jgi:hypothetical protein
MHADSFFSIDAFGESLADEGPFQRGILGRRRSGAAHATLGTPKTVIRPAFHGHQSEVGKPDP